MPYKPDTASTSAELVATTPPFCANDADVIIRAEGPVDFRVNKCTLSFVSPVFKDMFIIPQPPSDTPDVLPHVDVQDPPGAWENILRTIYPVPNPTIDNLDDLESLLLTAKKYEMKFVIDSHLRCFEDQMFVRADPLRLYAIACASGLEEQAKYVASHAEISTVVERSSVSDLKCLTWDSYHRLVSFLVRRDKEWSRTLANNLIPNQRTCKCCLEPVFKTIKEDLGTPYFSTDKIYLKAMEASSQECGARCAVPGIKEFIDLMAKKKDELCSRVMW